MFLLELGSLYTGYIILYFYQLPQLVPKPLLGEPENLAIKWCLEINRFDGLAEKNISTGSEHKAFPKSHMGRPKAKMKGRKHMKRARKRTNTQQNAQIKAPLLIQAFTRNTFY